MFASVASYFGSPSVTFGVSLNFIAVSLLVVAIGVATVTIWFWISARPEPQSLAPLEIMGEREFAQADDDTRKLMLNSVRAVPTINSPVATSSRQIVPDLSALGNPTGSDMPSEKN